MALAAQTCVDSEQRVFALAIAMAGVVETSIERAIQALLTSDEKLVHSILEKEPLINQIEMQLDEAVLAHMGSNHLPAEELRFMSSLLKINKDLERMGDLAANIARKVLELEKSNPPSDRSDLQPLAIAVSHLSRKTLQALVRRDPVLAESALETGATVYQYREYASRRIRERMDAAPDVVLLLASRELEQIAGTLLDLARSLVFWLRPTQQEEAVAS
jgi:phosphate transport system protein